jgi:hypothetical protein
MPSRQAHTYNAWLTASQSLGARILDSKRKISQGEALGLKEVATVDAEVVARYVETKITIDKNRGKAKSYDEKQLEVGEFNEAWLDGIDERIRKMRVAGEYWSSSFPPDWRADGVDFFNLMAEDFNNEATSWTVKNLKKKVKATGVRTTF